MRLDIYLFENNFSSSRNKAAEMIKSREVKVDGKVITKTSYDISNENIIEVEEKQQYVSRAANKLKGFLQNTKDLHVKDKNCLDIGSSTGGFAQVLIEYGANSVTCVDVGKEQLHVSLRNEKKILLFEETDIRKFKSTKRFDIVTCDVSFIGMEQIIGDIDRLANDTIIILFKPQFEVGRDVKRNKKGVVKDNLAIKRVKENFEATIFKLGWKLIKLENSIIKGKEGNEETFYCFSKR